MRSAVSAALAAALAALPAAAKETPSPSARTDPPVVLGEAYAVDGVTYTPADVAFDDVGLAGLAEGIGDHVAVAHRTLPIPSYVEITALDGGRTILARIERRGPMRAAFLIELSAAGFAQLGADPGAPLAVRVRRVSPQEFERTLLRTGQLAPERLATPKPLLEVLRKRLAAKPAPAAETLAPMPRDEVRETVRPVPPIAARPMATELAAPKRGYEVQVASFAGQANAAATAKRLGGKVVASPKLWQVRLGPFASQAAAGAALAQARRAGFADARLIPAK